MQFNNRIRTISVKTRTSIPGHAARRPDSFQTGLASQLLIEGTVSPSKELDTLTFMSNEQGRLDVGYQSLHLLIEQFRKEKKNVFVLNALFLVSK